MIFLKKQFKNIDKRLLILPILFLLLSIIMLGSISGGTTFKVSRDVIVQSIAYILGFIWVIFILNFDYHLLKRSQRTIYIGSIIFLLLVYIPGLGIAQFGARSWLNLRVTTIQPSEFVKITFILIMAKYFSGERENLNNFKAILKAGIYGAPFILIVLKEDLGTAAVMSAVWLTMLFYAGINRKSFIKLLAIIAAIMPITYFLLKGYQRQRIDAFLNPENLNLPGNYQVWQSKITVGSGGFFGKGLFEGTQKGLDFLPVQKSDFIFSVIVEELGFLGGTLLIIGLSIFIIAIFKVLSNCPDLYGRLILAGFIAMFIAQIFENIAMTMGIMPVTGITLPFISYGGSSILSNMIALGFIINICKSNTQISF